MNIRSFGLKLRKAVATLSITTLLASLLVVAPANAAVAPAEPGFDWVPQEALALFDQARRAEVGNYELAKEVTKAQAVVLGYRALGITGEFPVSPLTGVPEWAMQAFNAFYAKGFVKGEGSTTASGAENTLARVVLAQMACNALGVNPATAEKKTLTDAEKAEFTSTGTEWGMDCMAALAASANGEIFKQMRPAAAVNRAEAATIWFRVGTKLGVTPGGSTPTDPVAPTTGGDLEVSVSDNNPDDARVPGSASNVEVAVFDFEAGKSDVTVTQVQLVRGGLGSDDVITNVSLFDGEGFRLSNSKSFNSDDEAFMNFLGGGLKVPAGETVEVHVVAEVGTVAAVEGEEFFVAIEAAEGVTSSADEVSGDFPVEGAEIEIGGSDASELIVTSGNSVANVNVGEQGVKVETFELEQDGDNDITLYAVNFKQSGSADEGTDLGSYELYIEGDKVAGPVEAKGEYVAFELEEGFLVEEGQTYDGEIRASILGGADEDIDFEIDETTDVRAEDESFGFGAQVTVTDFNTADTVDIEAGEITVVAVDPEKDEFREGQDNVILGTLRVTSLAGESVEAKKLTVDIEDSEGVAVDVDTVLENLEVVVGGSVYDLSGDDGEYENDDLDILLSTSAAMDFVLRADVVDDVANLDAVTFDVSVSDIGGATEAVSGFYFEETDDDTAVTDVTPSSLTFDPFEGTTSSATVTALTQSAAKSAVVGSEDVVAFGFEVDASSASAILIDEVVVSGDVTDNGDDGEDDFDNTRIAKLSLYVDEVKPENLVDTVSGSQIASEEATFESFGGAKLNENKQVVVEADKEREFYVTVDLVDDVNQEDDTFILSIDASDISAEDDDNEDVSSLPSAAVTSTRTVTITGAGDLTVTADNSDTLVNRDKHVLGGTEAFVASYELTAEDEDIIVRDLTVRQHLNTATITVANAVTVAGVGTVTFTDEDGTETEVDTTLPLDGTTDTAAEVAALIEDQIDADANLTTSVSGAVISITFPAAGGYTNVEYDTTSTGGTATVAYESLEDGISKVMIYDQDKTTKLAEKSVTDNTVEFTDVNLNIPEGSKNLYVKVLAHRIGKDLPGSQTEVLTEDDFKLGFDIEDAEGQSGNTVTATASNGSNDFSVVPVNLSGISFVNQTPGGEFTVESDLTDGENVLAIVKVVNAAHNNSDGTTGVKERTELGALNFDVFYLTGTNDTVIASPTLERLSGADDEIAAELEDFTELDGQALVTFNTAEDFESDQYIDSGDTAYYILKASVTRDDSVDNDDFVRVEFNNLDDGNFVYGAEGESNYPASGFTIEFTAGDDDDGGDYLVLLGEAGSDDQTTVTVTLANGDDTAAEVAIAVEAELEDVAGVTASVTGAVVTVTFDPTIIEVDDIEIDENDTTGVATGEFHLSYTSASADAINEARLNTGKLTAKQLSE